MPLVTVSDLRIGFRGPALLDGVYCQIDAGQRIGLLGRNGSGKTTFMRILTGEVEPDGGDVHIAPGVKLALLPQDVPHDLVGPIRDVVAAGLAGDDHEHESNWHAEQEAERLIERMQLPSDARVENLSSGMKRRVLLARALVGRPDLLLLDEPTNHLDVSSITWLEEFLLASKTTLLFVTHDRMFLQRVSNRIIEVDRGQLFDWSCDYTTFLTRKQAALEAEEKQNALFDKRLAEEEVWIRKGIQARRTRNEGRVRALEQMRRDHAARRNNPGKVQLEIQQAQRSGALVVNSEKVNFAYDGREILRDFSITIMRDDKVGVIGPNGAGKTTLLRVLLGQLQPQSGSVRLGTNLKIAYFDQLRQTLKDDLSVQENVGDGYDSVTINGQSRHIIGYLQDFLFSPERARTPVKFLSGGERNRVLLAKLFSKPANVIVLDEPTNDLDAETLELLEERLMEFTGAVIVVSHDRAFLNNVVTSTIVFEEGIPKEYAGGYDDWVRQRDQRLAAIKEVEKEAAKESAASKSSAAAEPKKRKLSFKEKQERDSLPTKIEKIEAEVGDLHAEMGRPEFYQQGGDKIALASTKLKTLEDQLNAAYARWEELEQIPE